MIKDCKALPDDHYLSFTWGQYPGDRKKGFCTLNQRLLEQMPKGKRVKLLNLIQKAMRG